ECALSLAFPWQESAAAGPVRIVPPFCRQCGDPFPGLERVDSTVVCGKCSKHRWHFQWARAAYRTQGQVLEAVLGFKYNDQYYQHGRLVGWLAEAYDHHARAEAWDAVVPVPLYHRRHRERGFNQASELARGLARKRKIRVLECLYRCRETSSQTKLSRNARWENMAGAFRLKRGFDVRGLNLLVIDDVFTTGATTNACAQVLAHAGAGSLAVLTVARS
ncbi:MAG TPA: ComF family protein, partial [Candidatus Methylacidiphilales bacterium]|nr:ComF family protein [Candidatus Methylacidiphilales bacterium]